MYLTGLQGPLGGTQVAVEDLVFPHSSVWCMGTCMETNIGLQMLRAAFYMFILDRPLDIFYQLNVASGPKLASAALSLAY